MQEQKWYYVYVMASRSMTLYIGVTGKLATRVLQHKLHEYPEGFTAKYNVERLVYFEAFGEIREAIAREKQLKSWRREKKIALIETVNPTWSDLAESWYMRAAFTGKLEKLPRQHF
ncbi:MAG: GIY-YIG nuclease family protein [Candidatus Korobacteraceae bacterium]